MTAAEFQRINRIIEEKNFNPKRADCLLNSYKKLKNKEVGQLFLDLLERFLYIPLSNYPTELVKVTNMMLKEIDTKNFFIYNGLPLAQQGKIKSNYLISYQFKGAYLRYNIDDNSRKFHVKDTLEDLLKKKDYQDTTLVLVDDFIGSGKTIEDAITDLRENLDFQAVNLTNIAVVCIAAMKDAVERIALSGVKVYCNHILEKGISDYYPEDVQEHIKKLMKRINRTVKAKRDCYLGYNSTESLICMERCPNNTFPVFYKGQNAVYARF